MPLTAQQEPISVPVDAPGPPPDPAARRAAAEATSVAFLLALAAFLALLLGLMAFAVIRRRWIGSTSLQPGARTRLPDPWRESARRMERSGAKPDDKATPGEEPYQ